MAIQPNANYTISKQEFLNSVINKIGKQTYSDQTFVNPLKRFKREFIDSATDIEEIYVGKVADTGYDKEGNGLADRVKPTVVTQYHTNSKEHGYKVTVHDKQVRKGFTTKGGVQTLGDHIINSMHNGAELDEYNDVLETLKALCASKTPGQTISLAPVTSDATAKKFCKEVKKVIPKMAMWNKIYSKQENFAKSGQLVMFIDSDVNVEVQVEYLASLFNMTVSQLDETTKIVVPNLKTILGDGQFCVILDERCLMIHPTYYNVEPFRNTRGKFTNYDLVTETLLSYTDWYQFVVFKETTS